jgi:hypothetical protein
VTKPEIPAGTVTLGPPENGLIFPAIADVMKKMSAVPKDGVNQQQRFKFQQLSSIYNALHSVLAECGVFTVPTVLDFERTEKATKSGGTLTYTVARIRFTFFASDGSSFEAVTIGEGSDSGDKSANKSMSAAHKYALIQVFAIPTKDIEDSDRESPALADDPDADPIAAAGPSKIQKPGATPAQQIAAVVKERGFSKQVVGLMCRMWFPKLNDLNGLNDKELADAVSYFRTHTEEDMQQALKAAEARRQAPPGP